MLNKFLDHQNTKIILFSMVDIGVISLAGVFLLNLPSFHVLNTGLRILTFVTVFLGMFITITSSFTAFIFTNRDCFSTRSSLLFILFPFIFYNTSSRYHWTTQKCYAGEIFYFRAHTSSRLTVSHLTHPTTNLLYPPDSYGLTRYPLIIETGHCVME